MRGISEVMFLQDEYKYFLPSWRQEMKDNKVIKCPNYKVSIASHIFFCSVRDRLNFFIFASGAAELLCSIV